MVSTPQAPSEWTATDPARGFRPEPEDPLSPGLRQAVQDLLTRFLDARALELAEIGPELEPVLDLARTFTSGGKRLRPAFCLWGHVAAGGDGADPRVLQVAASLDLLHVSALVHDDLMDGSDTRRGVPSAHRQFEALHTAAGWRGEPAALGQGGAVLLGDLLLMWSEQMLAEALLELGAPQWAVVAHRMRTEVTAGQYLDLVTTFDPAADPLAAAERAHRVVEHKAARYTVSQPLRLGALLTGGGSAVAPALWAYGSAVGRAFQFRDDVLGVFGDEHVTGKPAGDDLREGKQTLLLAEARAGLSGAGLARLDALVGQPGLGAEGVAEARDLIETSGARARLETMIDELGQTGLAALSGAGLDPDGLTALTRLADLALHRSR